MFGKLKIIFASISLLLLLLQNCNGQSDSLKISISDQILSADTLKTTAQTLEYYNSLLVRYQKEFLNYKGLNALVQHKIGVTYYNEDNHKKAIAAYQKAIQLRSSIYPQHNLDLIKTKYNLGWVFLNSGNYQEARNTFENITKEIIDQENPTSFNFERKNRLAESFNGLSLALKRLGDIDNAKQNIEKAIHIFEELKTNLETPKEEIPDLIENLIIAYNDLANINKDSKNYKEAINYYQKVISLLTEQNPDIIISINNLALCHIEMGNYDKALHSLKRAESLSNKSEYPEKLKWDASINHNFGLVYNKFGKFSTALDYANKSLVQKKDYYNKNINHPKIALAYELLADINYNQKNFTASLEYYQTSINTLIPSFTNKDYTVNPTLSEQLIYEKIRVVKPLALKGDSFYEMYTLNSDKTHLENAMNAYLTLDTLLFEIRKNFKEDGSKYLIAEDSYQYYEKAIATASKLYELQGEQKYKEFMLTLSERNKAQILFEGIKSREAIKLSKVSEEILNTEKELSQKITQLEKEAYSKPENTILKNEIFDKKRERRLLIEKHFPEYYSAGFQNNPIVIGEIQNSLSDDEAIIEYFLGKETIYSMVISKDVFEVTSSDITEDFEEKIRSLLKEISAQNTSNSKTSTFNSFASYLYNNLLEEPIKIINNKAVTRLTIVPDGILGFLPFDVLLTEPYDENWTNLDVPFALKKYAFSYLYSVKQKINNTGKIKTQPKYDFGGFALDYSDRENYASNKESRNKLNTLPNAIAEVESIKSLVGGESWTNSFATKKEFKTNAPHCALLHLSLHGILDKDNPMLNHFVFYKENGAAVDEEKLYAAELYNMDFKAKMAVLSACNTGIGELKKGEGVMSISRGFAYAGCPSVVMSLWQLNDQAASQIMPDFYTNLKAGDTKDRALQKAKLKYVQNIDVASLSKPFYWANVILLGDNSPINHTNNWTPYLWGLAPFCLLLFFLFYRKKSKN